METKWEIIFISIKWPKNICSALALFISCFALQLRIQLDRAALQKHTTLFVARDEFIWSLPKYRLSAISVPRAGGIGLRRLLTNALRSDYTLTQTLHIFNHRNRYLCNGKRKRWNRISAERGAANDSPKRKRELRIIAPATRGK